MYGLFTRMGAGAVLSAGLSVLGVTYLCTDGASNHHHQSPPAVATVQADAALGAAVVASPSYAPSGRPANGNAANGNAGNGNSSSSANSNPGANTNPGSNTTPGSSHSAPDCGCAASNPTLVTVKPDADVDVDVVVTLPDTDITPGLVGGVLGTVGAVVHGVVPDCGCNPNGPAAVPPLPVLGH